MYVGVSSTHASRHMSLRDLCGCVYVCIYYIYIYICVCACVCVCMRVCVCVCVRVARVFAECFIHTVCSMSFASGCPKHKPVFLPVFSSAFFFWNKCIKTFCNRDAEQWKRKVSSFSLANRLAWFFHASSAQKLLSSPSTTYKLQVSL